MKLDDLPNQFRIACLARDADTLARGVEVSLEGASEYLFSAPVQGRGNGYLFTLAPYLGEGDPISEGEGVPGSIAKRLMELAPHVEIFPVTMPDRHRGWNLFTYTLPDGTPALGAFAAWVR